MTTAKGIFQVASNPEIRQIFAKQFYTVSGKDAANLVDNQGGKLLWQKIKNIYVLLKASLLVH